MNIIVTKIMRVFLVSIIVTSSIKAASLGNLKSTVIAPIHLAKKMSGKDSYVLTTNLAKIGLTLPLCLSASYHVMLHSSHAINLAIHLLNHFAQLEAADKGLAAVSMGIFGLNGGFAALVAYGCHCISSNGFVHLKMLAQAAQAEEKKQ